MIIEEKIEVVYTYEAFSIYIADCIVHLLGSPTHVYMCRIYVHLCYTSLAELQLVPHRHPIIMQIVSSTKNFQIITVRHLKKNA